jgi:hypothetical protein
MVFMLTLNSEMATLIGQIFDLLAYLDPGSGSIILQLIIAAAAGAAYTLRVQIRNFFNFIRGKSRDEKSDENVKDDSGK